MGADGPISQVEWLDGHNAIFPCTANNAGAEDGLAHGWEDCEDLNFQGGKVSISDEEGQLLQRTRKIRKHQKRRQPSRGCYRVLVIFGVKALIVFGLFWAVVALGYYCWALTFDLGEINRMPQRSAIYDRFGKFYSRLPGENRVFVSFDKVSNDFINALLAREDSRFYRHRGIDPIGILRAIVRNFVAGGFRQGASTITQQLARNSFQLGGRNFHRKLIEAALAYRIETELSKEAILEAYVNRIYFGSGFYGVEAASQAYFGKPASRLDLSEAAMLAGLIRSPNRLSPFVNPRRAIRERDMVLDRMRDVGFITPEECEREKSRTPNIAQRPTSPVQNSWAVTAIQEELGLVLDRDDVAMGGLKIYTKIDPSIQATAESSLSSRLARVEEIALRLRSVSKESESHGASGSENALQGAVFAMDNESGGILAIVGSRALSESTYNRALFARRQIGSLVKPFVFAVAFGKGLRPDDKVSDERLRPGELPREYGRYDPTNSDGKFLGELAAREHIIQSRNPGTVRVGLKAGVDAVAEVIKLCGISNNAPRYPSLFLGAFDACLREVTAAYTVFATGGMRLQPYLIERIEDSRGNVLFRSTRGRWRVFDAKTANMISRILAETVERGTASAALKLGVQRGVAGKTGTTDNYHDAWFVGYDRKVTCGVWVGYDQPREIYPGATGAQVALPIWAEIFKATR